MTKLFDKNTFRIIEAEDFKYLGSTGEISDYLVGGYGSEWIGAGDYICLDERNLPTEKQLNFLKSLLKYKYDCDYTRISNKSDLRLYISDLVDEQNYVKVNKVKQSNSYIPERTEINKFKWEDEQVEYKKRQEHDEEMFKFYRNEWHEDAIEEMLRSEYDGSGH